MNGVIQTGLMAFPELANELADACPAIELEAQQFVEQCTEGEESGGTVLAMKLAVLVMGIHAGCHRLGIPLCETISDMLTLPTDTINQRLKELENQCQTTSTQAMDETRTDDESSRPTGTLAQTDRAQSAG